MYVRRLYAILRKLGWGAYSSFWLAIDERFERQCWLLQGVPGPQSRISRFNTRNADVRNLEVEALKA
jgi:hypothetical protein